MKARFNVTGAKRKELVEAIESIVGMRAFYKKVPTFEYVVNNYIIDREGTVKINDRTDSEEVENLFDRLAEMGFTAEDAEEQDAEPSEGAPETKAKNGTLTIQMPRAFFTEEALENLKRIIESKESLMKSAFGTDDLSIKISRDKVSFPWFSETDAESANAYSHFVTAICEMAKNQKRITAKERETDNEKYAFRCFLLRLGFIGAEYKAQRKALLKNLTGSAAFKSGRKGGAV